MSEGIITQAEADLLLAMEKYCQNNTVIDFPGCGQMLKVPMFSKDRREKFFLDIRPSRAELQRITYQNRAREVIVLARLDINGTRHVNPDGEYLGPTHLHLYKGGHSKWAVAVPEAHFRDINDQQSVFEDFLAFCNVVQPPPIQWGVELVQ